jgi:MinD-like ATPase involved in chromosome partitioning or flagellar assembly
MTIRVATVLSAREWEPGLVAHARDTASLRVVLRAYQPADIESRSNEIDVVVAGGEVAWVTPSQIAGWRRLGFGVIGVHPAGDEPAAQLLQRGGANEVVPDTIDAVALVQAIRFVAPSADHEIAESRGSVIAVVGPRGAPGCTEVALAYASIMSGTGSTVLIDADLSAPALAVRLGLPARPDVTDAADGVREDGSIASECLHRVRSLSVITGSHRPSEGTLRDSMITGVIDAAAAQFDHVVLDVGADFGANAIIERADTVLLVVDASAVGIVRAAQVTSQWMGPQPQLILNRVDPSSRAEVVDAARRWTGLEPAAVVLERRQVRRTTAAAKMPDRRFVRAVAAVGATT